MEAPAVPGILAGPLPNFNGTSSQAHQLAMHLMLYYYLYNNKINARVLIGQSAMVYCAGKPMEKSRVF